MSNATDETVAQAPNATPTPELAFGSRQAILSADDTQYDVVELSEWNMKVRVRSLTAGERDVWEKLATGQLTDEEIKRTFRGVKLGSQHTRALVAYYCTLEGAEGGTRMFPDPADMLILARKHSAPLAKIFQAVIKLSAITSEELKELEADLDTDPTSAPFTDSQRSSRSGTLRSGAGR